MSVTPHMHKTQLDGYQLIDFDHNMAIDLQLCTQVQLYDVLLISQFVIDGVTVMRNLSHLKYSIECLPKMIPKFMLLDTSIVCMLLATFRIF